MNESSEVNLHFLDYWRVLKYRWPFVLISFLFVTGIAGVTCYFLPREYYAKVTMEVKPEDSALQIFSNQFGIKGSPEQRLSSTTFQIIQSKGILYPVIQELRLDEIWAPPGQKLSMERTFFILRNKMTRSKEVRNTDFIEIGVFSTNPQEAADIANSVASQYEKRRREDQVTQLKQGLAQLEEEINKKRKAYDEAFATAQEIRTKENIIDLSPDTSNITQPHNQGEVTQIENDVNGAKTQVAQLRTQLEVIDTLKPDALMTALRTLNIEDPTVSRTLPLYQDAVAEEARMLNSGLGENHPRIVSLRGQKEVFSNQLMESVGALRHSLATRLKVAENTEQALTARLNDAKAKFNAEHAQSATYASAKENYLKLKALWESSQNRFETLSMQLNMQVYPAKIWDNAEPPQSPAKPDVLMYMALAMGSGLLIGLAIAFFLEYLDTSVKTIDDVEKLLNIPVLAIIPKNICALVKKDGDSPDAEAYRILQTNLDLNRKDPNANTVTLVSGGVGEGKSTTINNLAFTYAKAGYKVLVVDADLRRSSQHLYFGLEKTTGLSDILMGHIRVEDALRKTSVPNLWFIPSGELPGDSRGILNSHQMAEFINQVKPNYDIIFFDSPPILGLSDAAILTSLVDITLMVVQYRRFPRSMLKRVKQSVMHSKGNILGAVLNNVDTQRDTNYQYYTQYYDYYRPGVNGKGKKKSKAEEQSAATPGDY